MKGNPSSLTVTVAETLLILWKMETPPLDVDCSRVSVGGSRGLY